MSDKPNPGSPEALSNGCRCAVLDNCRGKGRYGDGEKYGWYVTEGCPVHAPTLSPDTTEQNDG